jgi:MoxR-like ATPase
VPLVASATYPLPYPLDPGAIRQIPVLHLKYGNRILAEIRDRGPLTLSDLFSAVDPEELFKGEAPHKAAKQRARALLRLATDLGLVEGREPYSVTNAGADYLDAGDADDIWLVTPGQAAVLQSQIRTRAATEPFANLALGAVLALSLIESNAGPVALADLGQALGFLGGMIQWQEEKTFISQAERFTALLQDAELVDAQGLPTDEGRALLATVPVTDPPPLSEALATARLLEPSEDNLVTVRAWVIRAGREGEWEALALEENVCVIGWSDMGEIPLTATQHELRDLIQGVWGGSNHEAGSAAGMVYKFVQEVEVGDLVVLPLMTRNGHVAIGRVTGDYEHRMSGPFEGTDAQNTRPVEWLDKSVGYERFDPDLREAFGLSGTLREITKPDTVQRLVGVLSGADASAIDLVLKWSPARAEDTIDKHRAVAEESGAVWWGRVSKPGATGLAENWLTKFRSQLEQGSKTTVFLYSSAGVWRTELFDITLEEADIDSELVPDYYDPDQHHSLWVKLAGFEEVDASDITGGYVLASDGEPVTEGGLGNQTPLIIRKQSSSSAARYFIISQVQDGSPYDDAEGERYHWTSKSAGATKQLANSPGARFVYYRPGTATDGTSKSYFGTGRIGTITRDESDGVKEFVATIDDYERFQNPVAFADGPRRNAQVSIQTISRSQFEKLLKLGLKQEATARDLTLDDLRDAAVSRGLSLEDAVYVQVLAALASGKHVILTGPPGTAKTTLAQIVGEVGQEAGANDGYVLTTATADWTTYETIGGLQPTEENTLKFSPGHFLKAIEGNQWLVIDELNRSQFDRAFGQLFTVLSGQPVVLPYHRFDDQGPLVLVPEGTASPIAGGDVLVIPRGWRILATMNVFDKTLLFEMSFALMRRFAFIEVPSPSRAVFEALIEKAAADSRAAELTISLLKLRDLKDLGPAVYIDCAKFLRERIALEDADDGELLFEAFYSYFLPQFEGIDTILGEQLFSIVGKLVDSAERKKRLRSTLEAVLGLQLSKPKQSQEEDDSDEAEAEESSES